MGGMNVCPRGAFRKSQKPSGYVKIDVYPDYLATKLIFLKVLQQFGVTRYRLGKLLGLPYTYQIGEWMKGQKRPSSLYMSRLAWLMLCQKEGLEINRIRSIDWDGTAEITWMDGYEPESEDSLFDAGQPATPNAWSFVRGYDQYGVRSPDAMGLHAPSTSNFRSRADASNQDMG